MTEQVNEHPFVPGARVAIKDRWSETYTEGFVEKTYKNGRFTLRGSSQQWRPWRAHGDDPNDWWAMETGSGWHRPSLRLWNDHTDAEISAARALAARVDRRTNLVTRLKSIAGDKLTDSALNTIELALSSMADHQSNGEASAAVSEADGPQPR